MWPGIRRTHDPFIVDNGDLHDDVAQNVRRVGNGAQAGRVSSVFDAPAHIQQRLVDFTDRAQNVFFEHQREIMRIAAGLSLIQSKIVIIFSGNACPQHRNDDDAENRRAAAFSD